MILHTVFGPSGFTQSEGSSNIQFPKFYVNEDYFFMRTSDDDSHAQRISAPNLGKRMFLWITKLGDTYHMKISVQSEVVSASLSHNPFSTTRFYINLPFKILRVGFVSRGISTTSFTYSKIYLLEKQNLI